VTYHLPFRYNNSPDDTENEYVAVNSFKHLKAIAGSSPHSALAVFELLRYFELFSAISGILIVDLGFVISIW
jgi:hypothetical protein